MPEQPLPMFQRGLLRLFKPNVKIIAAIFVLGISIVLAAEKLFRVEELRACANPQLPPGN